MKKKITRILRIVLMAAIFLYVSSALVRQNYAATLEEEKKKQQEIQKELKNTQAYLKELEDLKGDTEAYIKELDVRLNELTDSIYNLEAGIELKKAEISAIMVEIENAKSDISAQYEAMKLRIQYMYENGQSSYIDMIFGSENMNELFERAEYLTQITAYDRQQLVKYQEAKLTLEQKETILLAEEEELEGLLAEAKAEQTATEELMTAKQNVIAGYDSQISGEAAALKELEEELAAQKAIVAELEEIERKRKEEAAKNQVKLTYDGGKMIWPLPGYSRISSKFGYRSNPFGGSKKEYHNGIDIPAPRGTEIKCAYDGQVAWSSYSSSAGNWVGVDHGNGYYTIYMHMSKRKVNEGDMVKKGDVLGLVGTTGRSTGNHLHFSIRIDGNYVNPSDYVAP